MTTRKLTAAVRPAVQTSTTALASIEGWDTLTKEDQSSVREESIAFEAAREAEGKARVQAGEHLFNIQEILTKTDKRIFTRFLESLNKGPHPISRATAYRYIELFLATRELPGPVRDEVMRRGSNRLNVERIESTPLPRTNDPVAINEYITELEKPRTFTPAEVVPEDSKRNMVLAVVRAYERLPRGGRVRSAWMRSVVAMLLYAGGITEPVSITPVPIPESYTRPRGRPREMAAAG